TDPVASIANYTVTGTTPGLTLGRPIGTLGGTIANVPLLDPSNYVDFADRINQVDLRLSKGVRIGRYRVDIMADFYNAFNVSPVQTYNNTYTAGPANQWLVPTLYLQSAFLKLGGRFTF